MGTVTGSLLLVLRTGHSHRDITGQNSRCWTVCRSGCWCRVKHVPPCGYGYYAYYSYYLPGYEAVEEGDGRRTSSPRSSSETRGIGRMKRSLGY